MMATRGDAFMSYRYLGLALEQLGRFAGAIDAFTAAMKIEGADSSLLKGALGYAYGRAGRTSEASRVLAEPSTQRGRGYVSPFSLAVVTAGLRDADATLQWLDVALREKANQLVWLKVDPRFDFLRAN